VASRKRPPTPSGPLSPLFQTAENTGASMYSGVRFL
jgi:hypothetical protein